MNLQISEIPKGRKPSPLKGIIYGENGIGKSTFCAGFKNPVFLDLEGNIDHLDCHKQALSTYQEALEFLDLLTKEEHDFKTVVVDSLDILEQMIWTQICQQHGWKSIVEGAYGAGFTQALELWNYFKQKLSELRLAKKMNVLLIAHEEQRKRHDPSKGEYYRTELRLQSKAQGLLFDWVDFILYATLDFIIVEQSGPFNKVSKQVRTKSDKRVLYTNLEDKGFIAKNIFNLPLKLPLESKAFLTAVRQFYA